MIYRNLCHIIVFICLQYHPCNSPDCSCLLERWVSSPLNHFSCEMNTHYVPETLCCCAHVHSQSTMPYFHQVFFNGPHQEKSSSPNDEIVYWAQQSRYLNQHISLKYCLSQKACTKYFFNVHNSLSLFLRPKCSIADCSSLKDSGTPWIPQLLDSTSANKCAC